jgi:AraC-like DNA-binding protein
MARSPAILNPDAGAGRFTLETHPPSPALADFVERYWIVRWNLAEPFAQETLPDPLVNVVVGDHQPGIWGPQQRRFTAELHGRGSVVGAKFRPGGLHPWLGRDLATIANTTLPVAALFDIAPFRDTSDDDRSLVTAMESMLLARTPAADPNIGVVSAAVDLARDDPALSRCDDLAARLALAPRTLERLFRRYVGVSAKWVMRRFRVQEACARAQTGSVPDWSRLATDLGYFDQSHFIRDFKSQVGRTPADYAALCAADRPLTPPRSHATNSLPAGD